MPMEKLRRKRRAEVSEPAGRLSSLLAQFRGKEHSPLVQFVKYGLAGGVATGVHIIVFTLLAGYVWHALTPDDPAVRFLGLPSAEIDDAMRARRIAINNFGAFLFSNLAAYILNVKWVFEGGRHHRAMEVAMFYAVSGVSVVVGTALAYGLAKWAGVATTYAFGANIVAAVMINYVMRKFVIFKG